MFKRVSLALAFLAALTVGTVVTPDSAEARRRGYWGRPYVSRYYHGGPAVYYGRPYRSYYYGPRYYPRSYYYGGYYPRSYYYGPRSGVYFSFGW